MMCKKYLVMSGEEILQEYAEIQAQIAFKRAALECHENKIIERKGTA